MGVIDRLFHLTRRPSPSSEGVLDSNRHRAPHCDQSVLHAPGRCEFCDAYPQRQRDRELQRINFSDEWDETKSPCPSAWFRSDEVRNRWGGNRPMAVGAKDTE